jgi:MFS family permease
VSASPPAGTAHTADESPSTGVPPPAPSDQAPASSKQAAAAPAKPPHPRRHLIFAFVSVALLMTSIDQNIVATVLPVFQRELHAPINWATWTINIYSLGRVIVLPLAGRLSDQLGRRTIFLLSIAIFTAASLACGMVDNIYLLVALRGVQAIGGSGFMPSAVGIVSDNFGQGRDRAIGLFASLVPMGAVVGPTIGSLLVAKWDWQAIFFVNIPIGVVLLALGAKYIPNDTRRTTRGTFDRRGMTLMGTGILAAMFATTTLGSANVTFYSPQFLLPAAMAVITCWLFLRHTNRAPAPFIPPLLLHGPGFRVMNTINLLYGGATIGFSALVPIYANMRYGINILGSGTLLGARAIGMSGTAILAAGMMRRTGYRLPMTVGFLITAIGMSAMALPPMGGLSPYLWLVISSGIAGVGNGMIAPSSNNAGLQLAPEHAAAISGLRGTFRQAGSIMSVAITSAILARSSNPGIGEAYVFAVFAGLALCMLPLMVKVPEHRGSW